MVKTFNIDGIKFEADIVMERFKEVFDYIGSFILDMDDIALESIIYEDYDFCYTDLADFRLDILCDAGYITSEIKCKAQTMRLLTEKMFGENMERSAFIVRKTSEWKQIISIADEIRYFLNKE